MMSNIALNSPATSSTDSINQASLTPQASAANNPSQITQAQPATPKMCAICLDDIEVGAPDDFKLHCDHHYHRHCIENWVSQHPTDPTCPQDREPLNNAEAHELGVGHMQVNGGHGRRQNQQPTATTAAANPAANQAADQTTGQANNANTNAATNNNFTVSNLNPEQHTINLMYALTQPQQINNANNMEFFNSRLESLARSFAHHNVDNPRVEVEQSESDNEQPQRTRRRDRLNPARLMQRAMQPYRDMQARQQARYAGTTVEIQQARAQLAERQEALQTQFSNNIRTHLSNLLTSIRRSTPENRNEAHEHLNQVMAMLVDATRFPHLTTDPEGPRRLGDRFFDESRVADIQDGDFDRVREQAELEYRLISILRNAGAEDMILRPNFTPEEQH